MNRILSILCLGVIGVIMAGPLFGEPDRAASIEPKTIWDRGFELFDQAEAMSREGQPDRAIQRFTEAMAQFDEIRRRHPEWNAKLIRYRLAVCQQRLAEMQAAIEQVNAALSMPPSPLAAATPLPLATMPDDDAPALAETVRERAAQMDQMAILTEELEHLRQKDEEFTRVALLTTRIENDNRTLREERDALAARIAAAEAERQAAVDNQAALQAEADALAQALKRLQQHNQELENDVAQMADLRAKAEQADRLGELVPGLTRQRDEAQAQAAAALAEATALRDALLQAEARLAAQSQTQGDAPAATDAPSEVPEDAADMASPGTP